MNALLPGNEVRNPYYRTILPNTVITHEVGSDICRSIKINDIIIECQVLAHSEQTLSRKGEDPLPFQSCYIIKAQIVHGCASFRV